MISKKFFYIYLIYIISLFVGLLYSENSSGGAKIDANYLYPFILKFSEGLTDGLLFFLSDKGSIIHSPIFYILIGSLHSFINSFFIIKIIYILFCCLLPYIFYLILKERKYIKVKDEILFYFSLIIFYSPYFRDSSTWVLGDNLSLIFFSLSILYYLKGINEKLTFYFFISVFSLILCSYIRYYYCIFVIFFLFEYLKYLNIKYFLLLLFISTLFSS